MAGAAARPLDGLTAHSFCPAKSCLTSSSVVTSLVQSVSRKSCVCTKGSAADSLRAAPQQQGAHCGLEGRKVALHALPERSQGGRQRHLCLQLLAPNRAAHGKLALVAHGPCLNCDVCCLLCVGSGWHQLPAPRC